MDNKNNLALLALVAVIAAGSVWYLAQSKEEATVATDGQIEIPGQTAEQNPADGTTTPSTQMEPTQEDDTAGEESDQMPASYQDVLPAQAKQLIDTEPDLVIIDVSPFYAQGHLPDAISYAVGNGSLAAALDQLDQTKPYLVYCHNDDAAIAGAETLVNAGFSPVYRLEGNYSAWVDAGYETEI